MRTVDFFKYSNQVTLMSAMDKRMLHTGNFHTGITLTTMLIMETS